METRKIYGKLARVKRDAMPATGRSLWTLQADGVVRQCATQRQTSVLISRPVASLDDLARQSENDGTDRAANS